MLTPGFVLQNRYQVVRMIAQGGTGAVYEALDQRLNSSVALKESQINDDQLRNAYAREARLLAGLRHPALPKVTDHFSEGESLFLVMEFIPGPNLAEVLQQRGVPFPVDKVVHWSDQLLDALEYLHAQQFPIIHRDIKPQNLKLTERGEIILLDFGLGKGTASQTLSMSANTVTLGYVPLEQTRGIGVDGRSDIYSLGATMYYLLTGRSPLDVISRASDLASGQSDQLVPPHILNPDVPIPLSSLIDSAMALNRDLRPATAAVFRDRLRELRSAEASKKVSYETKSVPAPMNNIPVAPPPQTPVPALQPLARADFTTRPLTPISNAAPLPPPIVSTNATQQFSQSVTQPTGKKRSSVPWLLALVIGLLILFTSIIIIVIIGPGLWFKGSSTTLSTDSKPKVVVPSPYDESLKSIASVVMENSSGQPVSQTSGFFVKDDQIVVPLSAINGATRGHIRLAGKTTDFDISGVVALDRDRGIAILKLDASTANPVSLSNEKRPAIGDKLAILGISATSETQFAEAAASDYKQTEDVIEIRFLTEASSGSLILDEHGQPVGMVTSTPQNDPYLKLAVPIARVAALSKRDQQPLSLVVAGANQLLYDFRRPTKKPGKKIAAAAEQKILSAIFPAYLKAGEKCSEEYTSLEQARATGQINPAIEDSATGSFTSVGAKQTAYTINVGECGASHADGFGSRRLVIFENQRLVANVDADQHSDILQVVDLDQDGINELLLEGSFMNQGISVEHSILADFQKGKLQIVHDFGQVSNDSCNSGLKKSSSNSLAIFYAPSVKGQMPEFRTDVYRATCGGKFRYVSTGKLTEQ